MITTYHFSYDNLYKQAGDHLISHISHTILSGEKLILFLSGGSVVALYPSLRDWIEKHQTKSICDQLIISQVDERYFGEEMRKSEIRNPPVWAGRKFETMNSINDESNAISKFINAEVIRETDLWDVCEKKGVRHILISQKKSMEESISEYNQTISSLWKSGTKTIAVLGMGVDGHTAGLLPGYQKEWDRDAIAVGYTNNGAFPHRISLTPTSLCRLDASIVVVSGKKKKILVQTLERIQTTAESYDRNIFPAGILGDMSSVHIFEGDK